MRYWVFEERRLEEALAEMIKAAPACAPSQDPTQVRTYMEQHAQLVRDFLNSTHALPLRGPGSD